MRTFRKKPVEVQAIQFVDNESSLEIIEWMLANKSSGRFRSVRTLSNGQWVKTIAIDTLEGEMYADLNDWVIRGVKGEFYPCKPDIFNETYEEVES